MSSTMGADQSDLRARIVGVALCAKLEGEGSKREAPGSAALLAIHRVRPAVPSLTFLLIFVRFGG
jgi:hypothetical protein